MLSLGGEVDSSGCASSDLWSRRSLRSRDVSIYMADHVCGGSTVKYCITLMEAFEVPLVTLWDMYMAGLESQLV